ncbi:MAG: Stk1 family PASTA domain-containing Ser/Thr kinase [Ruminococcaceae bacterium]|nr:Stk1 family PASTA domain-containing Ser/Thr kinase [Oscillospiraceae bacterium]
MDKYTGMLLDGRYELLEPIGHGGMAVVYKARCHRLNRLVAVKILKEEYSKDADFKRRFEAESRAVAMLSHPNIVSVYDVSRSEGLEYIVMELIDGMSLKDYMLKRGRLGWRETLHFATLIAKALEHAHSRGVIHRDIKPHNIMVLRDGSVKVADFGIARFTTSQHTLTQEALGSVHYISPEQARGSQLDARTDIYSLGVVMYEMMTGRLPYDGDSPVAVAIAHINSTPILPHEIAEDIPAGLEYIAMKAMTADLKKRYASASDMYEDLETFRKDPEIKFGQPKQLTKKEENAVAVPVMVHAAEENKNTTKPQNEKKSSTVSKNAVNKKKKDDKKNKNGIIAAIICILIFVGGLVYFLTNFLFEDIFAQNKTVMVPQFIGVNYDAISNEDYPDFNIELEATKSSDEYVSGVVMSQNPESGREVKSGATIKLTVSSGENIDTMPDVVNTQQQVAMMTLDSLSVMIDLVLEQEYSDYVEGYVIRTDPTANTILHDGDKITLVVSLGPKEETVVMPSLIGLTRDEAEIKLLDYELALGEVREFSNEEMPAGTVYFQSVEHGTPVAPGTSVNLYLSLGPEDSEESQEQEEDEEVDVSDQPDAIAPLPDEPALTQPPSGGDIILHPDENTQEPVLKDVIIKLPQDVASVKVTVKLNQETVFEDVVLCDSDFLTCPILGTGQQFMDIYFDDILKYSDVVDFN